LFVNLAPIETALIEIVKNISNIRNEKLFLTLIMDNFYSTLLLKKINTELQNIRSQRNLISISDFTSIIAGVVKDQPVPFIYLRVGEKFRNFMIDEFQDTSEMQWQNLLPLIENSLADSRLSMLVGDGKQAIYRFKNGDAGQFVNLPRIKEYDNGLLHLQRQKLLAGEYEEKHLLTNYRSRKEIVDFNNAFFKFAADRFVPANINFYADVQQKCREDNTGGLVSFDIIPNEDVIKKVLEIVDENKAAGYQYGDIAILTRVNRDAVQIAEALQAKGISVVSSESLLLCSSPQVNFLVNWIAFMSNNDDKVSIQGIVEYLFAYFQPAIFLPHRTDSRYLYEILAHLQINIHQASFNSLSFYDSVELLVREFKLGVVNPLYTRFFLDQVLDFSRKDSSGPIGFLQYWNDNSSKLSVSIARKKEAVQILTVHKSKGLDFPVVIYAFPDPKMNKGDLSWQNVHVKLPGEEGKQKEFEIPLVFNYSDGLEGTPLEAELREEEDKVSLDKFNLYYVAFTRASERLFVVIPESSKIDDPPKKLSDLVHMLLSQVNEGNRFGSGERVEGHYKNLTNDNNDLSPDVSISYQPGEWRNRIVLSKRSPEEWPVIRTLADEEGSASLPGKTDYGKLVHKILSGINSLDEAESTTDHILERENIVSPDLKSQIMKSLNRLKMLPEAGLLFKDQDLNAGSGVKIINEQEILTPEGESYRPDRVILLKEKTLVIDFKTGMPNPKYIKQVKLYADLISKMGYPDPQGYIVYLGNEPEIIKVSLSNSEELALN
ncbi:MAG: UvrD-helicase domain-containing protein, partial [Chloroflexota bacterium]